MKLLEDKISFFINEVRLSETGKSLAYGFRQKFEKMTDAQLNTKYIDIDTLKNELLTIIQDKSLNVSPATRKKNILIVQNSKSKKDLIHYIWNIILAGDGEKILKK